MLTKHPLTSIADEIEVTIPRQHAITDASSATARYAEFLRQTYRELPTLQKYKCLPSSGKKPTQLVVVTETKRRKTGKPITMEDLLRLTVGEGADARCSLIEGERGVGKSVLATELCLSWEKDEEVLRKYSLVVLVRLQEKKAQEAKHIVDLFYHPSIPLQQAVVREITERDGDGTLIIFDGVDQLPSTFKRSHPMVQILEGSILTKARIILTSSCSATSDVEDLLPFQTEVELGRHVKVLGFSKEEIQHYAESSLSSDSARADECLSYLSNNPALYDLMGVPFNCSIIVEAYKQAIQCGKPPPQTMTQVYHNTLQQILRHYMLVKGTGSLSQSLSSPGHARLEDLPAKVYQQLCSLAQFAFTALLKQETVFHKLPRNCNHFGFMHANPELYLPKKDAAIAYSFLHVGFQQYLAALHLSRLPPAEQRDVVQRHIGSPHLSRVWQLLAGITGMRSSWWELAKASMCVDNNLSVQLLRCLYEAHEKAACQSALGSWTPVFSQAVGGKEILPTDIFALGWCLGNSICSLSLRLRLDGELLRMLSLGLRASGPAGTSGSTIETLYLRPPVCLETMETLSSLSLAVTIHGLDFSHCDLKAPVLNALAPIVPKLTSLRNLDIRGNRVGEGGLVQLLHALSKSKTLQSLSMINVGLGSKDVTALSLLVSRHALKELRIGDEGMTADVASSLLSSLMRPSSLQCLHLWFADLTTDADSLEKQLKSNSNISTLEFHACRVGSYGCRKLAKALETNTTMKALVLSMFDVPSPHQIGVEGATALADMLRVNSKLESLELCFDRSIGRQGASALVDSLKENRTLRNLKIPQQHFQTAEIRGMDTRVRWSGP